MRPLRSPAQSSEFGLVAWLQNTRVALPLKGVACRFEVTGAIACVELDQIYHQNTDRPLECTYSFPLPAGAAVYRCELHVNGRVIRAKVEAMETAQRMFQKQKAAGRRAALVETERENLFTLSLGNTQPGDVIVVRFAWFQVLERSGDGLRLFVPTCPGIRYIPGKPLLRGASGRGIEDDTDQVPDASRITPPRIDALHPDAAYFSIEGRLSSADVESGTASSPSHPIFVREINSAMTVELSTRSALPDRDFVLSWREPRARQLAPQAWRWTEGGETYALVQLRAPEEVQVADGFPQDFYFLVDRSGSMGGAKWQRTCQALRAFVGLLGADDRVWITLFQSGYRDFAEAPMPAPRVLADRGFQRMEALGAAGGTELLPAARHVLQQIAIHSSRNRASVVLITDGEVGNDQEIVRAFQQAPHVRVHTFGIDTTVNDAFLKSLARQQRGGCWLQTPDDDIAGTVAALGDRLRRPVLTDLSVRGSWEAARSAWPDLHAHEVATVALRSDAATPLEITGRLPDGTDHCFAVDLGSVGSEAVKLLWAKERMTSLIASNRQHEALALARQHTLICEGAAFIAWDEAEQVPIAEDEIVQPALEPSVVRYSRVLPSAPSFLRCSEAPQMDDGHSDMLNSFAAPAPRNPADLFARDDSTFGSTMRRRVGNFLRRPDESRDEISTGIAEVLESFHRAAVPAPAAEALVVWAQNQKGPAAVKGLSTLRGVPALIAKMRSEMRTPILSELLERCMQPALGGCPETLLRWAAEIRPPFTKLLSLRRQLSARETPDQVIDHLAAWVLEPGRIDIDRLHRLEAFADAFDHLPFSADAEARHWRTFLGSIVGLNPREYAFASRWFPEPAVL